MATAQRTSIFRKGGIGKSNVYEAAPKAPERKMPPDPLDLMDGWPRIVGVRFVEPNPAAPDDRSQDIEKIAWSAVGTHDPDAQALLALETAVQINQWARTERKKVLQEIGVKMAELQAKQTAEAARGE